MVKHEMQPIHSLKYVSSVSHSRSKIQPLLLLKLCLVSPASVDTCNFHFTYYNSEKVKIDETCENDACKKQATLRDMVLFDAKMSHDKRR